MIVTVAPAAHNASEQARQLAIFEFILDEHRHALARQHRSVTHVAILPQCHNGE
jgi:hypothetical protein